MIQTESRYMALFTQPCEFLPFKHVSEPQGKKKVEIR